MHLISKLLIAISAVALSGCWVSDRALFTAEDYAVIPMDGEYEREMMRKSDAKIAKIEYLRLPDNKYRQTVTYDDPAYEAQFGEPLTKVAEMAFVAIPSEHEDWYLAFEFDTDLPANSEQTEFMFFIAKVSKYGGMQIFQPNCSGTEVRSGMTASESPAGERRICTFESKETLLAAAEEVVDFLNTPQIVSFEPLGSLSPKMDSDLETLRPIQPD